MDREIKQQTVDQIVDSVMSLPERSKIQVLAPVIRGKKESIKKFLNPPQNQALSE